MSEFTTIRVTRHAARKYLVARLMDAADFEMEDMLDTFLAERLYNSQIVHDDEVQNDDEILGD